MPIHAPFLKYFLEVAHCGSVRLAASRLFISSSAVNRQILNAEEELGTRLFDRVPGGMELTAAGQILAEHAKRTLDDADRSLRAIEALDTELARPLTIAGQESVIGEFLSPVLVQFHVACAGSCSAFRAAGGDQLVSLLRDGQADLVVAFDSPQDAGIEQICARALPVGAIVSPDHPLAAEARVTLADCARFALILPDASWPLRPLLDQRIADLASEPAIISTSNSVEFLRTMVDRQLGVGFQTAMGIEASLKSGQLVHVPLCDPEPLLQKLSVCLAVSAPRSLPLQQLLSLLEKRLHDYAQEWA